MSDSLWPHGLCSPWNSPGQNTGVGSLSLLQGIFPTQGSNPGLHCRWILYQMSHKGSPRILEWVAYPFFSGSSQPRNWTMVSWIAGGFFTSWDTREALWIWELDYKEGWAPNWWLQVVLDKTLESLWTTRRLNQSILKEIQCWIFIWRNIHQAEA